MQYKPVKARKQGTSLTLTIPADIEHDRKMIEASFDSGRLFTPKEMKERFGKYGWGKHED